MPVGGNVASGATDSGNPVKTGGKYNASAPTLTDGQRGDTQLDANGNAKMTLATAIAGENIAQNRMRTEGDYSVNYISTATTTQVVTGAGVLHAIVIGTTAAGAISIIDNTTGSTVNIGELKTSIVEGTYIFDCRFTVGLRIITAAASKISVIYRADV